MCDFIFNILLIFIFIRNKAVLEWNKYHWVCPAYKSKKINYMSINNPEKLAVNEKHDSTLLFNSIDNHQEIPTILNNIVNKKLKVGRSNECKMYIFYNKA